MKNPIKRIAAIERRLDAAEKALDAAIVTKAKEPPPGRTVYCSFCGKSQHEVRKLIAGPRDVFICDECVVLCVGICMPPLGPAPREAAE